MYALLLPCLFSPFSLSFFLTLCPSVPNSVSFTSCAPACEPCSSRVPLVSDRVCLHSREHGQRCWLKALGKIISFLTTRCVFFLFSVPSAEGFSTGTMTENNNPLFSTIRGTYGGRCVVIFRKVIDEERQAVRLEHAEGFLKDCKTLGILPRSLWYHLPGQHDRSPALKKKVDGMLLRAELSEVHTALSSLRRGLEIRRQCLFAMVTNSALSARLEAFLTRLRESNTARLSAQFETRLQRLQQLHGLDTSRREDDREWEERLVHNVSSANLDADEIAVLRKGLNFAVSSHNVPRSELIASVEAAIVSLPVETRAYVRKKASTAIRNASAPRSNLSRCELDAIERLRAREDVIVLPADKGRAVVVMDLDDYRAKLRFLIDEGPYATVKTDPGARYRRELHRKLSEVLRDGRLDRAGLLRLCPTHYQTPHIFGLPKIHKPQCPLRPIVSMRDTLFAPLSRLLADILRPYVSSARSYIKNSFDLVDKLRNSDLGSGQFITLDVESLFTKVPLQETLSVFHDLLTRDDNLEARTFLSVAEILELSRIVLTSSYFIHFDGIFVQSDGVAMGSSLGPVAACIFMNFFEELAMTQALSCGVSCPSLWLRYVDDVIIFWPHDDDFGSFYNFLNQLRPSIRFNVEREVEKSFAFLDINVSRGPTGVLCFSVFRKPTHTDSYLHRDSNHPTSVFKGIVSCLATRARRLCSSSQLDAELDHLSHTFRRNGYPAAEVSRNLRKKPTRPRETTSKRRHSIPYVRGVSERLGAILREVGVEATMGPTRTLRSLLVRKRPAKAKQLGNVYRITCSSCPWTYVGETGRCVDERRKEHLRACRELDVDRSEVARHVAETGHKLDLGNIKVLDRETSWRRRVVKEAIWTRKLGSSNKVKHDIGQLWHL